MKRLIPLFVLMVAPLGAEEALVKEAALLRQNRNVVSIKPGTSVEVVSRDGVEAVVKYRGVTGKILLSKLEDPKSPGTAPASTPAAAPAPAPAAAAPATVAKAPQEKKPEKKAPEPAQGRLAENPQTGYGKMVKKAKDTVELHDRNLVRPTNEVTPDAK